MAVYRTPTAQYVAYHTGGGAACQVGSGNLGTVKITPGNPPKLAAGWCAALSGYGAPMVTTTDGLANAVVWAVFGNSLMGLDGDTGSVIEDGDTAANHIPGTLDHFAPVVIEAKGRIFVASSSRLSAYTL
jgi:hypothetical protein